MVNIDLINRHSIHDITLQDWDRMIVRRQGRREPGRESESSNRVDQLSSSSAPSTQLAGMADRSASTALRRSLTSIVKVRLRTPGGVVIWLANMHGFQLVGDALSALNSNLSENADPERATWTEYVFVDAHAGRVQIRDLASVGQGVLDVQVVQVVRRRHADWRLFDRAVAKALPRHPAI